MSEWVREELLKALGDKAMTFDQAAKAIPLPMGKVKPEVQALLPELLKSGRVQEIVAAKRAWYFAPKVVTIDPALAGLKIAILKSVGALEPEVAVSRRCTNYEQHRQ